MMLSTLSVLSVLILPAFAFDIPPNDGFVTDTVAVFSDAEEAELEQKLRVYTQATTNEIAVLIVETLGGEPIADVAVQVGRAWGIGSKEKSNGILLLVAYADRQIFVATGYGLEGAIPDIVAKGIVEEDILPNFRDGKYPEGITQGVEAIMKHIAGEYTAERYEQAGEPGFWSGPLLFLVFILFEWLLSIMARTKSWWLGGIAGLIGGILLTALLGWWLSIPLLAAFGLFLDVIVSRDYKSRGNTHWWAGGTWGPGGSGGGGFSGFSGGSFGGGGAGGRW